MKTEQTPLCPYQVLPRSLSPLLDRLRRHSHPGLPSSSPDLPTTTIFFPYSSGSRNTVNRYPDLPRTKLAISGHCRWLVGWVRAQAHTPILLFPLLCAGRQALQRRTILQLMSTNTNIEVAQKTTTSRLEEAALAFVESVASSGVVERLLKERGHQLVEAGEDTIVNALRRAALALPEGRLRSRLRKRAPHYAKVLISRIPKQQIPLIPVCYDVITRTMGGRERERLAGIRC